MTHSAVLLVIYAAATFRLTRLATTDTIFVPARDWLFARGFKKMVRAVPGADPEVRNDRRKGHLIAAILYGLATCPWCVSVWLAAAVVLLAKYQGSWFVYVALALALSAVAGIVSERV
jgi:hypothetical protein